MTMKKKLKFVAASLAVVNLGSPAIAADLAARPYTKAPPMVATVFDWSGFYIGINGGGGSSRNCWSLVDNVVNGPFNPALNEGCNNATGGTVGGQIGYRWQAANWVFGLEGQGNWANFSGSNADASFANWNHHTRMDSFGLLTGQVGYAWNNVLLYVKGGAAVTGNKYERIFTGVLRSSADETRWGATVGAGLEIGFAQNWSIGIEYDHIFTGNNNVATTFVAGSGFTGYHATSSISQDVDMGLVRLNYRFGGPMIAKY